MALLGTSEFVKFICVRREGKGRKGLLFELGKKEGGEKQEKGDTQKSKG